MHELRAIPSIGNRVSGTVGIGPRKGLRAAAGALAAVGLFIAAEVIARLFENGVADLAAFVLCVAGVSAAVRAQKLHPVRILSRIGAYSARFTRYLAAERPRYGLDLRGGEVAAPALPSYLKLTTAVALAAAIFSLTFAPNWSEGLVLFAEGSLRLVRVVLRGSTATVLSILIAKALVDAIFVVGSILRPLDGAFAKFTVWASASIVVLLSLAATLALSPWLAFASLGLIALLGAVAALAQCGPRLRVVWTARGEGRGVAQFSDVFACRGVIAAAWPVLLAQIAGATRADFATAEPPSDLLPHFATFYAWIAAVSLAVRSWSWLAFLRSGKRRDPAKPVPISVLVGGEVSPAQKTLWVELLGREGHRVRFENTRGGTPDVTIDAMERLRLLRAEEPTVDDRGAVLLAPSARERVERRAEIRRRRSFYRGVEKLFKTPCERGPGARGGSWFALQHWFSGGLLRGDIFSDDDPVGARRRHAVVGPAFERVFSPAARAHYHDVMSALDLDLVYIDEGTDRKSLLRAFSVVFEYYDLANGRRRAEERFLLPPSGVSMRIVEIDALRSSESVHGAIFCGVARARVLVVGPSRDGDDRMDPVESPRLRRPVGLTA